MTDAEAVAWAVGFIAAKTVDGESLPVVKQLREVADNLNKYGYNNRTYADSDKFQLNEDLPGSY